jgi:hypothetical protein
MCARLFLVRSVGCHSSFVSVRSLGPQSLFPSSFLFGGSLFWWGLAFCAWFFLLGAPWLLSPFHLGSLPLGLRWFLLFVSQQWSAPCAARFLLFFFLPCSVSPPWWAPRLLSLLPACQSALLHFVCLGPPCYERLWILCFVYIRPSVVGRFSILPVHHLAFAQWPFPLSPYRG